MTRPSSLDWGSHRYGSGTVTRPTPGTSTAAASRFQDHCHGRQDQGRYQSSPGPSLQV